MKIRNLNADIFMPFHIGSGNRGCEAITRATALQLGAEKNKIHVLTNEIREDVKVGLNKIVSLDDMNSSRNFSAIVSTVNGYMNQWFKIDIDLAFKYYKFLKKAKKGDIVLITGGDLYCYPDMIWQLKYVSWLARIFKCKTILWGCSLEMKLLDHRTMNHLKKYDAIYARESLTHKALLAGSIKQVTMIPDSAFILSAMTCPLPGRVIENDVIGINVSSYTNIKEYSTDTVFYRSIVNLIQYIIDETNMQVILIPHVFWNGQDDRIILKKIFKQFIGCNRIILIDSKKYSYCQLRFIISQCRFFIGSRTHTIISAYAMKVPSIALGYSVKSKGIAKDLGLPEELVIDCMELRCETDILNKFLYMIQNEIMIKQLLHSNLPAYTSRLKTLDRME